MLLKYLQLMNGQTVTNKEHEEAYFPTGTDIVTVWP